jgi:uncharacterized membrane protein
MVQGSFRDIVMGTAGDIHPPLFYFILKVWNSIFGDSVLSMRLLPSILTSATIFFIYPISAKVLNRTNSFLVLLLYCLSPLNLFFSQEVRMACLNVLLNTASVYFFIKIIEKGIDQKYYKNIHSYLYIVASVFALYTHYFSFFILFAQLIFILYAYRSSIKALINYAGIYFFIAICYLPWLPTMFNQVSRGQPWRYRQNISQVLYKTLIYTRDITLGFYHRYINSILLKIFTSIILLLIILSLFSYFNGFRKKSVATEHKETLNFRILIFLLVFVPLFIAILVSFKQSIEFFRYLSILIPFIIILCFIGFQEFPKPLKLVILIIFILINLYGDYLYYHYDFKNDDYREIINTINSNYQANDKVYVYPYYFAWSIDYYCKQDGLNFSGSNSYGWEYESLIDTLEKNPPKSFWFVLDYHSPDSSTYNDKVERIRSEYNLTYENSYKVIPDKVVLYKFDRKN